MVVISPGHLSIGYRLAKEMNRLAKNFSYSNYSKMENIDRILLKRDISVERKKEILLKTLHASLTKALSVNKGKLNRRTLESLKVRLAIIRKVIDKLRGINYYLETTFFQDLGTAGVKIPAENQRMRHKQTLARDELEALEYMAYRLIEKVVVLDKRLLEGYAGKEKKIVAKEKTEIKDLGLVLAKESEALEHLEAKLPPPRLLPAALMKEPWFTHWVARVLALLSYIEHQYSKETRIFSKLKTNKSAKARIGKKIVQLARERSRLLDIMEDKAASMGKPKLDDEIKKELRSLTTTITL